MTIQDALLRLKDIQIIPFPLIKASHAFSETAKHKRISKERIISPTPLPHFPQGMP